MPSTLSFARVTPATNDASLASADTGREACASPGGRYSTLAARISALVAAMYKATSPGCGPSQLSGYAQGCSRHWGGAGISAPAPDSAECGAGSAGAGGAGVTGAWGAGPHPSTSAPVPSHQIHVGSAPFIPVRIAYLAETVRLSKKSTRRRILGLGSHVVLPCLPKPLTRSTPCQWTPAAAGTAFSWCTSLCGPSSTATAAT